MKRALTLVTIAAAVVVLAACNVTVTPPGPPANTIDVTANMSPNTPVNSAVAVSPGQSQVFNVTVPGAVNSSQLLYIELDRDIDLEVLPQSYQTVSYSASDRSRFSSGRFAVQGAAAAAQEGFEAQSIVKSVTCRGSCVIVKGGDLGSEFYVRVRNDSGVTASVSLYVYGDVHADGTEPQNDAPGPTAPQLNAFDSGALETVGDIDYWYMPSTGNVAFDTATNGPVLHAFIVNSSGNVVAGSGGPYLDGQSIQVVAGEYLRIWTADSRYAASSARSRYDLEYLNPLARD